MPEPLKNLINKELIQKLSKLAKAKHSKFDTKSFHSFVFDKDWKQRELKDRLRHVTHALGEHLPPEFPIAISVLKVMAPEFGGLEGMLFPDFVEIYGKEKKHRKLALDSLEEFTKYSSSEFAIRPFLIEEQEKTFKRVLKWSKSKNEHVRRLSSEGIRPKLPWAMQLPALVKDPTPILPILENLKADQSLYVRRSVANCLNDISKDHPNLVLKIAKMWIGKKPETDKLIKHALRTLLKAGNNKALKLFGYTSTNFELISFKADKSVKIGKRFNFSFEVNNPKKSLVRIEYALYFLKKNGTLSKKVFKISEKEIKKGNFDHQKSHDFKLISTRKYHPGIHGISIILNGKEIAYKKFKLNE